MKNIYSALAIFILVTNYGFSQESKFTNEEGYFSPKHLRECVSQKQREEINLMLNQNLEQLKKRGLLVNNNSENNAIISFSWPLRKKTGLNFNSYFAVNNFVDQDNSSGLEDYYCGTRTYDGHKGSDFDTWPFPWYIYDNNFVEVIAAEAGTIIYKNDGNNDDCSLSGTSNAVYIRHSDNSIAWYVHLKKNSLTSKGIGETVSTGEYLGIIGSSGSSTTPHLHFEVYKQAPTNANNLIDPFHATCNNMNGQSWWSSQREYREPTLNALLTHDEMPVHGCGSAEEPHISDSFAPNESIYFGTYYSDESFGDTSKMKILKPDGSVWQNWNRVCTTTLTKSVYYTTWVLPPGGPFGAWKFEVEYQGQLYSHEVEYLSPLPVELLNFSCRLTTENLVRLNWSTGFEMNNLGFFIEHSHNSLEWGEIDFLNGKEDSSQNNYEYFHRTPNKGDNYYRLKQLDFDNNIEYSKVISITLEKENEIVLTPNPTVNGALQIIGDIPSSVEIIVFNRMGTKLKELNLLNRRLDISEFPDGLFFISIKLENRVITEKIIKR